MKKPRHIFIIISLVRGRFFGFPGSRALIATMAFALSILPLALLAQQSNGTTVSIRATATVIDVAEIEMITIKNMEMDISSARDGIIDIPALSDPRVGVMMVKGKPGAFARVTYLREAELMNRQGRGRLKVSYEVNGYPDDNQRAGEPLDATEKLIKFNLKGEYFLWIGGRLDVRNARPGSYEGEFTIEIEYI